MIAYIFIFLLLLAAEVVYFRIADKRVIGTGTLIHSFINNR